MSNKAKWRNYPVEEIKEIVASSFSEREVARKLGYAIDGGGTKASLKKMYLELGLDTSHFKGQAWNKANYNYDSFQQYSYKKSGKSTRDPLIALRGQKCENCGLTEWLGLPINLEVHHINGDRTDNRLENLQLLCPNCHSYTSTFAKSGNKRHKTDDEFVTALRGSASIHQALRILDLAPYGSNYERAWKLIDKYDIEHLKKNKKEHQSEKSSE